VSGAALARHDAVLFDLDGVLVDSRLAFARAVNHALLANGLQPLPEEDLHRHLGPPLHETFRTLVAEEALIAPCVDSYRARYREHGAHESSVFDGIAQLLGTLSRRAPLLVATSKPRALAEPLLEELDLRRYFQAVLGPELDSEDEQKAVTIARAIELLPSDARALMVGDRRHDIAGAHANGIPAVGVLWGIGSEAELRGAGAEVLVRSPAELARLLGAGDG
jgi:phosphoglycolate phosphatase